VSLRRPSVPVLSRPRSRCRRPGRRGGYTVSHTSLRHVDTASSPLQRRLAGTCGTSRAAASVSRPLHRVLTRTTDDQRTESAPASSPAPRPSRAPGCRAANSRTRRSMSRAQKLHAHRPLRAQRLRPAPRATSCATSPPGAPRPEFTRDVRGLLPHARTAPRPSASAVHEPPASSASARLLRIPHSSGIPQRSRKRQTPARHCEFNISNRVNIFRPSLIA